MDRLVEEFRRALELYEEGLTTRDELLMAVAELLERAHLEGQRDGR